MIGERTIEDIAMERNYTEVTRRSAFCHRVSSVVFQLLTLAAIAYAIAHITIGV